MSGGVGSGLHVLAVDDSLVDRKLIERLLTKSDYRGYLYMSALSLLNLL